MQYVEEGSGQEEEEMEEEDYSGGGEIPETEVDEEDTRAGKSIMPVPVCKYLERTNDLRSKVLCA